MKAFIAGLAVVAVAFAIPVVVGVISSVVYQLFQSGWNLAKVGV